MCVCVCVCVCVRKGGREGGRERGREGRSEEGREREVGDILHNNINHWQLERQNAWSSSKQVKQTVDIYSSGFAP